MKTVCWLYFLLFENHFTRLIELVIYDILEMDLRNTVKNGVLYLQDTNEKKWNPHFFVLTRNKLYYTGCVSAQNDLDGEEEADSETESNSPPSVGRHREVLKIFLSFRITYYLQIEKEFDRMS